MSKEKVLSAREEIFCRAYCAKGSPTWSNATKSKELAGYADRTMGNAIYKKAYIRERIDELLAELLEKIGLTPEKVLLGILNDQECARNDKLWSVSNQCSKLLGDTYAMFSDRHIISTERTTLDEMTPEEKAASEAAAELYKDTLATNIRESEVA